MISKKSPNAKMRKNAKNYQTLKKFSSLVSLTRHFTEFIFLEQLTAMPQFNMQNMFFFFFFFFFCLFSFSFFLAVIMIRTLYFICCIIFVKKYNYILANINSESSRVIFSFFCLHPVGETFLYPRKFCNHLKHSAR